MPMHRCIGMDFGFGGWAQTSAQQKCVWATRTSQTLDKIIQFVHLVLCYGVTFSEAKEIGCIIRL